VAFAFVGLLGANAFDDENQSSRPSLLERLRGLDRSRKGVRP
jgi:hypothetical protein